MSQATPEVVLAVFGDTHGHLRLMFQLARLWQLEFQTHLDGILQCGDLGFFPDPHRLDKATKRFAAFDPEKLGFAWYFRLPKPLKRDARLEKTLSGDPEDLNTVRCPVLWCHGNHEHFDLLQEVTACSACSSVDVFGRLNYLRSGEIHEIAGIRIAGIGGAPEEDATSVPLFSTRVSAQAVRRLSKRPFDILLSHGSPRGIGSESDQWGSSLLRELVERQQPRYHFFAHHRRRIPPATLGETHCFWHNDTNFQEEPSKRFTGPPEPYCMGILRWRSFWEHSFEFCHGPWFDRITGRSWEHLCSFP